MLVAGVVCWPGSALAAADERDEPVVLEGGRLAALTGIAPERLVAFRYTRTRNHRHERWTQIPVQVDERKFADFGSVPPTNTTPGSEGTVYGGNPIGHGALQYADPDTWVGPDSDSTLDADDEVALMSGDGGDRARKKGQKPKPKGVRGKRSTRIDVIDPLGGPARFVYLYESKGELAGDAGTDYVSYDFNLTSGDYRSTYKRRTGPNPEASRISTAAYQAGFSDRWFFDHLAIEAGGASGVEISDGFKFSFGPMSCGRSEASFNGAEDNYGTQEAGEGAFVANVDGPVRAIRAYVGANSGPLTERTHVFYRDRYEIITDLRVHAVPGPLIYHDLGVEGLGMTYFNSANQGGVQVDGVPETIDPAVADWHLWSGSQGSLFSADRLRSSFEDELMAQASTWYLDDSTPAPNLQCWGDDQALGQAGMRSTAGMPNTDPSIGGTETLRTTTTDVVGSPGIDPSFAALASERLDAPLGAVVKTLKP
jgi:hypothetical protein